MISISVNEPSYPCNKTQGRVVQKPVNANPVSKVNRKVDFSSIKLFFTAYVLCIFRSFKLKSEELTI